MLERSVVTALSKSSSVNKHGLSALVLEGTVVKACGIARSSPSCDSSVSQEAGVAEIHFLLLLTNRTTCVSSLRSSTISLLC